MFKKLVNLRGNLNSSSEKITKAMNEKDRPAQSAHFQPRQERIHIALNCLVHVSGGTVRGMTIHNISKKGLSLRGEDGLFLKVREGDRLVVNTELNGVMLRLEGVIVRLKLGAHQEIALGEVNWYQPGTHTEPGTADQAVIGGVKAACAFGQ